MTIQSRIRRYIPNYLLPIARKYCPNIIRDIIKYHKGQGFESEQYVLLHHGPIGIPYEWAIEQNVDSIQVLRDETNNLPYVRYGELNIYYPATIPEQDIKQMYNNVINIEQDIRSPHCYLTNTFSIDKGEIVVDCGASEGFFFHKPY